MLTSRQIFRYAVPSRTVTKKHLRSQVIVRVGVLPHAQPALKSFTGSNPFFIHKLIRKERKRDVACTRLLISATAEVTDGILVTLI